MPYAEKEVRTIRRHFATSEALLGAAATESAFKARAPHARILHLAAHNSLDVANVWQSKIELARAPRLDQQGEDGFLHAYEIFGLELSADLVVLSACDSGRGRLRRGEGLLGMSRAFLYAGAPRLVASLWPVADQTTAELMRHFYGHLAAGLDTRRALQNAQTDLIRAGYTHPFYWSAFILIGPAGVVKAQGPPARSGVLWALPMALLGAGTWVLRRRLWPKIK